jgi:hypothetical protein
MLYQGAEAFDVKVETIVWSKWLGIGAPDAATVVTSAHNSMHALSERALVQLHSRTQDNVRRCAALPTLMLNACDFAD